MRKYITLFFSVTLILTACGGSSSSDKAIDHDKMVRLLTDVHILDGRMYNVKQDPDSLYKYGTAGYLSLFKSYHIDSTQFRKSLKYYSTQPEELATIYEQVLNNLKQRTDSANKVLQKQYNAVPHH